MRTNGATTQKECYNLSIELKGEETFNKNFKTLKDISNELGLSYNRVVEMKRGRKKQNKGKYEPQYFIARITDKIEKDKEIENE